MKKKLSFAVQYVFDFFVRYTILAGSTM